MPAIKYKVNLIEDENFYLQAMVSKGKSAAHSQTRAPILLKAAEEMPEKTSWQRWSLTVDGRLKSPTVRGRRSGSGVERPSPPAKCQS